MRIESQDRVVRSELQSLIGQAGGKKFESMLIRAIDDERGEEDGEREAGGGKELLSYIWNRYALRW